MVSNVYTKPVGRTASLVAIRSWSTSTDQFQLEGLSIKRTNPFLGLERKALLGKRRAYRNRASKGAFTESMSGGSIELSAVMA